MIEAVSQYIFYVEACNRTPNWDIVDAQTQDYRLDLTPEERTLAEIEVNVLRFVTNYNDFDRAVRLVHEIKAVYRRATVLENNAAAAAAAADALEARVASAEARLAALEGAGS